MHRIRTRLMIAILVAAVLPAVPMSLVVGNLLERSLNPALHAELTAGLEAGMAVSRDDLVRRKAEFSIVAERALRGRSKPDPQGDWPPVIVLDERGHPAALPAPEMESTASLDEAVRVMAGHLVVKRAGAQGTPVVVAQKLPAEAAARAGEISEALSLLAAFRFERESILRSYVWPFLLVYAALILATLAVAATLSNRLARPLEEVARAATHVAEGNLETRVHSRARGEVGDLVGAFNDMVIRLGQQRQELARLEKLSAWRGMARMLAHEIKNPLTPILLAVQEAKNSYRGDDEAHAAVLAECEIIVSEEVDGLRGLVRSFSDFARPPKPECKPEDVDELLESLDRLYGDRLEVDHDPQIGPWSLDAAQMKRALINLIDNGLTACERAGSDPLVKIGTVDIGNELQINVTDRGTGISSEDLRHIFEPDFTTSSQGMGLGLPIVAGIVEAHGGTLKIATGDESGTQFTIALPRTTPKKEES
jgi:nitrogen fixation/metabolism regulation signal transduction histidine kinase